MAKAKVKEIKDLGYAGNINPAIKRDLLGLQGSLQGEIAAGVRDYELLRSIWGFLVFFIFIL